MTRSPALAEPRFEAGAGRMIFLAQCLRVGVRLGSAALLARLLTPTDYGLFGMAAAVFGVLYMSRDFGIVISLQHAELTPQRFNAACRIGFFGGLALAAVGALLALPTGWFFSEHERVPGVLAALSTAFIFAGLAAPALGVLYHEGKGGTVAMLEAAAMAFASLGGVVAAWLGSGVWALVVMSVVTEAMVCALAWRWCAWRPTGDIAGTNWRSLATLGSQLSGHNIATYLTRTLDQITIGRSENAYALGLYGRGAQITALPTQYGVAPFTSYIVAGLGRRRNSPVEYTEFFRRCLNGLLHVAFASAAVCVTFPELLVRGLFGPQWIAAAPVVRWLGVALAVQPWLSAPFWLLGAQAQGRRLLLWSLVGAGLMATGCALAAGAGMEAVAIAAAATAVLHAASGPVFCASRTGVTLRDWLEPMQIPAALHGGFIAVMFLGLRITTTIESAIIRSIALLALTLGYYSAIYLMSSRVRAEIRGHLFWSR